LTFAGDVSMWRENIGPPGAMQKWLEADRRGPINPKFSKEEIAHYRLNIKRDIATTLNWYRAAMLNVHVKHENGA
jgi:hypothetical protein